MPVYLCDQDRDTSDYELPAIRLLLNNNITRKMATSVTETTIQRHIFNAAAATRSSLKDCLAVEALKQHGWAENRLADFDLWAAGLGVSAASQASLDWRLHFQPEARIVLTNLLVTLREFVEQCRELATSNDASHEQDTASQLEGWIGADATANNVASSWFENLNPTGDQDSLSDSTSASEQDEEREPSNSVLDEAKRDTENMVDQLIRLGLAIRKSGTNARLRKADSSFKEENYRDLQRYLTLTFLVQTGKLSDKQEMDHNQRLVDLDQRYHQLSQQQKHLIQANLRRRHRFAYARRHHRKLEGSLDIDTVQGRERKEGVWSDKTTESATPSQVASKVIKTGKTRADAHRDPAMTTTAASAVEDDVLKAAAAYSQAPSRVSVTTAKLSYPSPPPLGDGLRGFTCPCCYQVLPIMFREKSRWRKHLSEDLSPYTCPFGDCEDSYVLYATRVPWKTHINTQHGALHYWECLACKGEKTFSSTDEFATHLCQYHKGTIAATQLSELQKLCHRVVPPRIESCPLCSWQERDGDPSAMIDHIGDCIHEFSLKALPWAELYNAATFCCPFKTEERVSQWLDATEPPKPIEGHQTDLRFLSLEVPAPAKDCLFVPDEYFAENADNSGSAERGPPPSDDDLPLAEFAGTPLSTLSNSSVPIPGVRPAESHISDNDIAPGGHSRNVSLGPEAALAPGQIDWSRVGPQFQGHRRIPSEYPDVSSAAPRLRQISSHDLAIAASQSSTLVVELQNKPGATESTGFSPAPEDPPDIAFFSLDEPAVLAGPSVEIPHEVLVGEGSSSSQGYICEEPVCAQKFQQPADLQRHSKSRNSEREQYTVNMQPDRGSSSRNRFPITTSSYALSSATLENWLRQLFKDENIHVTAMGDCYSVNLPRHLTSTEREEIDNTLRDLRGRR